MAASRPDAALDDPLDRYFMDLCPDAVLVVDPGGTIVMANARADAMFGYGPGELCGGPVDRLVAPAERPEHARHRQRLLARPTARSMSDRPDLVALTRRGEALPVDVMLAPLEVPERGAFTLAVVRDATESRRRDEELRALLGTSRRQAEQLEALHAASLLIVGLHDIEAVLQTVVETARAVVGARYGALAVFDDDGRILRFYTAGLSDEQRAALGELPKGRGLLGALLTEDGAVRVDHIGADARSVGFPPGHPPMTTFLGAPIRARGVILGNLYLTDRLEGDRSIPFDERDAQVLELIAAHAAVAVENARLYGAARELATVSERKRIARELHDSLAQVLGYVRLQAGLARGGLEAGDAGRAREAIERIDEAAVEAYADVREAILGLRSHMADARDLSGLLASYLDRYRLQSGIDAVLEVEAAARELAVAPGAEAQLLRIVQEALSNVRKHAAARRVVVRLARGAMPTGATLRAEVVDDGRGFDAAQTPSGIRFGLASMRERAELAGGRLEIRSAPGNGTAVRVELPVAGPPPMPDERRT